MTAGECDATSRHRGPIAYVAYSGAGTNLLNVAAFVAGLHSIESLDQQVGREHSLHEVPLSVP